MSTNTLVLIAPILVAVISLAVALWSRHVTPEKVAKLARQIMPGTKFDDLAVQASMMAYKVVEQKIKTYTDWTSEQKLAKAIEYMTALYDYFRGGKLTQSAKEALLEYEVYMQHQGAKVIGGTTP